MSVEETNSIPKLNDDGLPVYCCGEIDDIDTGCGRVALGVELRVRIRKHEGCLSDAAFTDGDNLNNSWL